MQVYNTIDQQVHQLVQTVTKFNRTYLPPKDDDSHTNLALDHVGHRIMGRWITVPTGEVIMGLDLLSFEIKIYNSAFKPLLTFDLHEKHPEAIEQAIEQKLSTLGLDPSGFTNSLHYEIPTYEFSNKPLHRWKKSDISHWIQQRSLASETCYWFLNYFQRNDEIRIWPHHFDTGVYISPNPRLGLGFGLAMKDEMVGAPYYYYAAYGLNGFSIADQQLSGKLSAGKWFNTDPWKGAALLLDDANKEHIIRFVEEVTESFLSR